ncbi:hypothetical protein [Amycolatopsis sp. NPDC098790]|uniref:hypothetical protein n=1 Tax=Amycolatopsis sp. NPDC098790 TaxID=3363939 RepID=UPI00380CC4FE
MEATKASRWMGVTWRVRADDSVSVEETGPGRECPPVLVVAGATAAVSLAVPHAREEWTGCVAFLLRLRDGVEELAETLASRAADPEDCDERR